MKVVIISHLQLKQIPVSSIHVTDPWPNKYDWFHKSMTKYHVCITSTMSCKQ